MGNDSGIIALLALGALVIMSRGTGISTIPVTTNGGPTIPALAVAFEEHLEENKEEIEEYERKRRKRSVARGVAPPIPVLTKALAYRAFLQEKPVRVTRGVYPIR